MNNGRATTFAVIACVLLALIGCSSGRSGAPSATPGSASPTQAPVPIIKNPAGAPVLNWSLTNSSPESDRVSIIVPPGHCVTAVGVTVAESASSVVITAIGEKVAEPCTQQSEVLVGYVHLNAPLGDRALRGENSK